MAYEWEIIGETGLQFFGKMSASLSHDIKNVLAIINEDAGLIEDYCLMADQGRPIDPERFKVLAGKIREQVRRADGVVKNLNRLAHSIDEPQDHIDISEMLAFLVALSQRSASMRGVTLELERPTSSVTATTKPFILQNLVWHCLNFAMEGAGENKTIGLFTERKDTGVEIRFIGLGALGEQSFDTFPSDREKALLSALGAQVSIDIEAEKIVITLVVDMAR